MGLRRYNREFKLSAVKLVRERSGDIGEAARNLGVDARTLERWAKKFTGQSELGLTKEEELAVEVQRLRKENTRLQMERDILKSGHLLREGAAVKFAFMQEQLKEYPVNLVCQVLGVSRNGYYDWLGRPVSGRQQRHEQLAVQVRAAFLDGRSTYGSPRVHKLLQTQDQKVSVHTVARIMREQGLRARSKRKFVPRTTDSAHAQPLAPNVLERDFQADQPDRKWATDITYIPTDEGWLYLAGVIDLYSRRIVGWAMAEHMRTELASDALGMALEQRRPPAGLLHHSDRGVQYASDDYQGLLAARQITVSMSGRGDCWDNAVMESFWGTLKTELVHHEHYQTREQARQSIFEYIEVFYNRQRLHSALGYVSPETFEAGRN